MSLPTFIPSKRRIRRKRSGGGEAAQPAGLVLLSATFDAETDLLQLRFNHAIDISNYNGSAVSLITAGGWLYQADIGQNLIDPQTLRVECEVIYPSPSAHTVLIATADNGIIAADSGAMWIGCDNLLLPFP